MEQLRGTLLELLELDLVRHREPDGRIHEFEATIGQSGRQTHLVLLAQILDQGFVTRPYLGLEVDDLTPYLAEALGLDEVCGVLVNRVPPEGPAAGRDILHGDVIVEVNGEEVCNANDLLSTVQFATVGEALTLELWRSGQRVRRELSPANRDRQGGELAMRLTATPPAAEPPTRLGLQLHGVTPQENRTLERPPEAAGVFVASVEAFSIGSRAGLKTGDVIVEANGVELRSPAELAAVLRQTEKDWVRLWIFRGSRAHHVAIPNVVRTEE